MYNKLQKFVVLGLKLEILTQELIIQHLKDIIYCLVI